MVITHPWAKSVSIFNDDETFTLLTHGLCISLKHLSMDFIVHGLDVHYALLRPLYRQVCPGLSLPKLYGFSRPWSGRAVCFTPPIVQTSMPWAQLTQVIGSTLSFDLDEGVLILLYPYGRVRFSLAQGIGFTSSFDLDEGAFILLYPQESLDVTSPRPENLFVLLKILFLATL